MSLIPYPNVPDSPGVPAIPRQVAGGSSAPARSLLGVTQGAIWRAISMRFQWGIWDATGKPLGDQSKFTGLAGELISSAGQGTTLSTVSFDYSKEMVSSDFPVEGGKFANYNKVEKPATASVTLAYMDGESGRKAFLEAIDQATKSTDLYSVVTPETQYVGYSIDGYSVSRRADRGATLLIVELRLKEVRQVSAIYTTSTKPKEASAAETTNTGTVQAKPADTSTAKKLADKFTGLFQ